MIRALLNAMTAWCAGIPPAWPVLIVVPQLFWALHGGRASGVRAAKRAALRARNRRQQKRGRGHAH